MKVKNIIELASVYLGLEEVLKLNIFESNINADAYNFLLEDEAVVKKLNLLTKCASLAINEISTEYYTLKKTETIKVNSTEIDYSKLSKRVLEILKVEKNGHRVKIKIYPTFFAVSETGELTITYTYMPEVNLLEDEISEFKNIINMRIIAYLVASEYCYICGLYEEAAMWENKFKDAIDNSKIKTTSYYIPARRWH